MGDGLNLGGVARQRGRIFWFALLASISWAVAASPFGCGLDDTAITQFGGADGSADGTIGVGEGGPIGDGGADANVCKPETCNSYPSVCRAGLPNGCGVDNLDCTGACPPDQGCIKDSGTCDGPPICHDAGAPGGNCETIINPGNLIEAGCGECANPGYTCTANTCTCGPGGTVCGTSCCNGTTPNCAAAANTCCKMKTCAGDYPGTCNGTNDNGCGGNLDCTSGTCGAQVCDTATHNCCTPEAITTACGTKCNTTATDNCNQTVTCGATCGTNQTCQSNVCACGFTVCAGACCGNGQVCNSGNNTCCTPELKTTTCALACGTSVLNNCGQVVNCGDCNATSNFKCESTNAPTGCQCGGSVCNNGDACCLNGGGGHFCHGGFVCN